MTENMRIMITTTEG